MADLSTAQTDFGGNRGPGPGLVSCERCRRRKVKCDRARPCMQCVLAKVECINVESVKRRPISRSYVEALEGQVASLELFIMNLAGASHLEREQMLSNFHQSSVDHFEGPTTTITSDLVPLPQLQSQSAGGHFLRMKDGIAAQFYGETSFYPIVPSVDGELDGDLRPSPPLPIVSSEEQQGDPEPLPTGNNESSPENPTDVDLTPHGPTCRQYMSAFFQLNVYYYHMAFYREYFLRGYRAGKGQYYSDLLLYAICSMGAMVSGSERSHKMSDIFYDRAQSLLHGGILDSPDITTIQALLILGQRDVGCGRMTKGWLQTGLAFRLMQEMGLHLDPNHRKTTHDSEVGMEVLRRLYWGCFIADKQLSLYFGRPPALHLSSANVQDSTRVTYPPDWDALINEYLKPNTTRIEYEDGVAFTTCFTELGNLSKIIHRMITEVFDNRKNNTDQNMVAATIKSVHVSLTKWLANLPTKLHWNQWLKDPLPPYVLHMHMFYHTALIILHRPPRQLNSNHFPSYHGGLEICEQSLNSICQLFKAYARDHGDFQHLPMTFIHIISTATSLILLKLRVPSLSTSTLETTQQLEQISNVVNSVAKTWPAAVPIQAAINEARQRILRNDAQSMDLQDSTGLDWQLDHSLQPSGDLDHAGPENDIAWDPIISESAIMPSPYGLSFQNMN